MKRPSHPRFQPRIATADLTEPQREQLETRATRPYPAPSQMYKMRRQEVEQQAKSDLNLSEAPGWSEPDWKPEPHRHIETSIVIRLTERMRRSVEDYLDAFPLMDERTAYAALLQLGLEHAGVERQDSAPTKAERAVEAAEARTRKAAENVRIAEHLYRHAAKTCKR